MSRPTAKERRHLKRLVALGCVVCRNSHRGPTPAQVHHIRKGQGIAQRAGHFLTIPLCPYHHTDGDYGEAFHDGREAWEAKYGSELELLDQVIGELMS